MDYILMGAIAQSNTENSERTKEKEETMNKAKTYQVGNETYFTCPTCGCTHEITGVKPQRRKKMKELKLITCPNCNSVETNFINATTNENEKVMLFFVCRSCGIKFEKNLEWK